MVLRLGSCRVSMAPPTPLGRYALGAIRVRLPPAPGRTEAGMFAQVSYPATAGPNLNAEPFKYFRPEVLAAISAGRKQPAWTMRWVVGSGAQIDPPGAPLTGDAGKWPIIVFSSGIWGCCEMYTQLIRELASFGAIVVALEWEDASGIYAVNGSTGEAIPYSVPPFDDPTDEDICGFRRPFLEQRDRDLDHAAATLKAMAAGSAGDSPLAAVLSLGDPDKLLLAAHSFGATGAVHYLHGLKGREVTCPFIGAVLADVWWQPLLPGVQHSELPVPFALFLSGEWTGKWGRPETQEALIQANSSKCMFAATAPGTLHQFVSESHNWLPQWLGQRIGIMGTAQHVRSYQAVVRAMQLAIESILDPSQASSARERVASIDAEVLLPFGTSPQ